MSLWMALMLAVAAPGGTNFFHLAPKQFSETKEAQEEIRFDAVRSELLSAAVLHETNRRRIEKGLPPVKHHAKGVQAAEIQSQIMKKRGSISHENPENPRYETLPKRVKAVGVSPGFAAENVATAFGLRYDSGKAFYKREERGKTVFSFTPNGPPIPPHTYASFAKALVDSWMSSPGHRDNILHKSAEYLGVSCVASLAKSEMPMFYCTQVFLAPLRPARR
ncbi:MAG: CAP domain-containing protein [Limisphaerales bacterium]